MGTVPREGAPKMGGDMAKIPADSRGAAPMLDLRQD